MPCSAILAEGWPVEGIKMSETETLYDVVAVNHKTGKVALMAEGKTERNAEAIERMAIMRRGLKTDFYATVPAGLYKEGDKYSGGAI